jgi:hypothetical protein
MLLLLMVMVWSLVRCKLTNCSMLLTPPRMP